MSKNGVTRRFTVDLDITTKNAEKKIKATGEKMKTILEDMGNASDRMTYFKELVDYLAQIDRALNAFGTKYGDGVFNKIFGGLDTNLQREIEGLFGTAKSELAELEALRTKLNTAKKTNASKDELKGIQGEVEGLLKSIGLNDKLGIDGRSSAKKMIEVMEKALDDFAYKFDDVNQKIANGFTFGGGAGGGAAGVISEDLQQEINKIQKQVEELEDLKKKYQNAVDAIAQVSSKGNSALSKDIKIESTVDGVRNLITEYDRLEKELTSGDKTSVEYYNNLIRMSEVIQSLKGSLNHIRTDGALKETFMNESGIRSSNQLGELSDYAINKSNRFINNNITKFDGTGGIDKLIQAKQNEIKVMSQSSVSNKAAAQSYNELYIAMEKAYKSTEAGWKDTASDKEQDLMYGDQDALDELIGKLAQTEEVADKAGEYIAKVWGSFDEENTIIPLKDSLRELCDILSIDLPVAADKAEGAVKEAVGTGSGAGVGTGVSSTNGGSGGSTDSGNTVSDEALSKLESTIKTEIASILSKMGESDYSQITEVIKTEIQSLTTKLGELDFSNLEEVIKAELSTTNTNIDEAANNIIAAIKNNGNELTGDKIKANEVDAKSRQDSTVDISADIKSKTDAFTAEGTEVNSIVQKEIGDLEQLKQKIGEVKTAVELKTQAFREEGDAVNQVVSKETIALDTLSTYLDTIYIVINNIVDGLNKINSTKLNDTIEDKSNVVVDNNNSTLPDADNEWALNSTLNDTNSILGDILTAVGNNGDLGQLITNLDNAVIELKNVANGIVQGQKVAKSNTSVAQARIADKGSYSQIRDVALTSLGDRATDSEVTKMTAMANGIVKVEGWLKTAEGAWEGFTVKVNESNEASKLAFDINSQAAKKAKEAAEELAKVQSVDAIFTSKKKAHKNTFDLDFAKLQKAINIPQKLIDKANEAGNAIQNAVDDDALKIAQNEWDALRKEIEKTALEQDLYIKKSKSVSNNVDKNANFIDKHQGKYNRYNYEIEQYRQQGIYTDTLVAKLAKYEDYLQRVREAKQRLDNAPNDDDAKAAWESATYACSEYEKQLKKVFDANQKFEMSRMNTKPVKQDAYDLTDLSQKKQALVDYVDAMYGGKAKIGQFDAALGALNFTIKDADGYVRDMNAAFNASETAIGAAAGKAQKATGLFGGLLNGILKEGRKLFTYFTARFGIEEFFQAVRTGVQYVKEIDDALTELKKVTNETDAGYDRFLQTMSKTAGVVGSTVAELTQMAAEWARLGYSISEAADLAESTAILLNVSEFEDATQASEALISTIQAFGYAAEESMDVVDIMNEIGNNYAVSSNGIAEALQNSASALMAGGNSMEEATAMIAAANKVVQDPNQVGSGLRTISLRLRGTSVSGQLEELGEETEGLVSASKMRDKIKGLAGVDILTDTGAYKSTYKIIKEIAEKWQDMDDMDQAALLELMAGKNRSNIMAALLTNLEDLEGAYEDAMDAEGSAYRENQAYLDSIQGRVDLFMNALQTFWMNLISSDFAKWIVDQGTAIIKFLDTAHGKFTVVTGVVLAFLKAVKGFDTIKTVLGVNFGIDSKDATNLSDVFKKLKTAISDLIEAEKRKVDVIDQSIMSEKEEAKANLTDAASEKENAKANLEDATTEKANAKANLEDAASEKIDAKANLEDATTEKINAAGNLQDAATEGTNAAQNAAGGESKKGLGALGKITLILTAATLLSAALDKIIVNAQDASKKTTEEFNEISDAVSVTKSNVESLEEELNGDNGINKQIAELEGKNLSFVDDQELQRLKAQKTALEHNLSIQKDLLKSQEKVKSERAVAAMKDFVKASNEGAESAKKTGKIIGAVFGGIATAIGIAAAPVSFGVSTAIGLTAGGAILGSTIGGEHKVNANAATVNTYEDWYKTYTDAYQKKSQAAADAREKYDKDPGNMDKYDKWQELEQEALDVQSKMYDNLTQMQNYYAGIDYGQSEALDRELDAWNNFLDKMNIDQNGAGAKVNAIDRIFGENASDEVKAFRKEIDEALKEENTEFDIAAEIEGRDDLQELEEQLKEIGITTDEVSDYFRKTGEIGTQAFSDLSGEIKAAETAMTKLQAVLGKNTNEGYETRNTGLEEMKDLMTKGAIGSESNLWNIAEAMGFTYDSAKSIEANADELYKFIKVRDDWYQVDEDGEWGVSSANAFAQDIENAVKNSEKLQELKVKWDFDESTGTLDFDFNNMKFDKIVEALGETKEAAGLTNDEFIDMLKHLGQFYNVQWASGNDIVSYLKSLEDTSLSAKDKLAAIEDPLKQLLRKQDLNPDEIADYLTGKGTLEKLPKDLQAAVDAYQKLHKEVKKSSKEEMTLEDAQPNLKSENIEKKQGSKLDGALTVVSILSMLGLGKFGKGKGAGNILKGPANSLDNKGLLSSLLGGLSLGKGKGISSLLGKGKNLLAGLLGKGALKGGLGALGKGALKVGSKFLGPAGWVASALTTIGPMITKQFSKGGSKGLLSGLLGKGKGLFGKIGQGLSKVSPKGLLAGLGLGATGLGISSLFEKFSGKKSDANIGVSTNIDGDVENLAVFTESVKELSKLDKNITTEVTANVEGNVTDFLMFEERLDNLKVFADSAKGLKNIGTIYSEVTANVDGNVIDTFEYKINNLETFVDSAKGIKDIGENTKAKVTADVEGNVFDTLEITIDNLKTYVDSAKGIKDIEGNISSKITADVEGNVFTTFESTINNLKTYVDSAKGIKDIEGDITSKIIADIDGNVFDTVEITIDNLKKYVDSAQGIKDIEGNISSKITANIDGNVFKEAEITIDNLKKYVDSAQGIKDIEGNISSKITADIDGNVFDTAEITIDNLKEYVDSAQGINNIKGNISSKITADIDGSVFKEAEITIDNLKKYVDSAQGIKNIEGNISSKITADIDGNVFDTVEITIDNLKKYVDSAQGIKELEGNITSKITADIDGNVFTTAEMTINNLDEYVNSAKGIKDIEGDISSKVTASIDGNVFTTAEMTIDNLKTYVNSAKGIKDIKGDISSKVTAEIEGNLTNDGIEKLKKFSGIATTLKSIASIAIKVTADVATEAINNAIALLQKVKDGGLFTDHKATVTVDADTTPATTAIQGINTATLDDKTLKISETGSQTVLNKLDAINNKTLNSKTVKVNYKVGTLPSIFGGIVGADGTAHADGTAFADGNWGAKKTETALVGELGPELLVRNGRWTTIGDNGAEFASIKKGDIIFNHRQTEELLKNGYVTSGGGRGKAYASGTAYSSGGGKYREWTFDDGTNSVKTSSSSKSSSSKKSSSKEYSDDFEEIFDWFEVRMEEIHEDLDLMAAKLENAITLSSKNNILDSMIATNKEQLTTLEKGVKLYEEYANDLLYEIPSAYRSEAKDGKIAIEDFAGAADEKTLEAIENYREWAQKVADLKVQLQETQKEMAKLAKQKFDNIYEEYDFKANIEDKQNEKLQSAIDYDEESGYITSEKYYKEMMKNTQQQAEYLIAARNKMQKSLDESVRKGSKNGGFDKNSDEWKDAIEQMYDIDLAIDECTLELEEFQNAINDIYWDNFDELIERLENISDETDNLIDLMGKVEKPVITPETDDGWSSDEVAWSDEGLAQLGLYAQKMEIAEYQAKKYEEAIDELNSQYAAGRYSESEYLEKLDELKDGQYDAIDAYHEAQEAMVDLNKARVDAIKEGIEKEIDAYEELIDKKQEELDAEKDLYDFQKSVMEQKKDISDIERQLAALSGDNSASARAKRKQLEAELAEANAALEETYYERSLEDKQTGLDKEFETLQKEKEAEIEQWEKYLEDIKTVVADTLSVVQANGFNIYDTLQEKAKEYNLTLSDYLLNPWEDGALAIDRYANNFGDAVSSTTDELNKLESGWQGAIDAMDKAASAEISTQNKENAAYGAAEYVAPKPEPKPTTPKPTPAATDSIKVGGKINAKGAKIYDYAGDTSGETQYFSSDPIYTVLQEKNGYLQVRWHKLSKGATGWFKKSDVKAYAKGSKKIDKDQLALIDELGEELVIHAQGGRLAYLSKGSGVVPADLTSNLMDWGELNPQDILDKNRPSVGINPAVHNTEINLNIQYGDMLRIENFKGDNPDEIAKIVAKQFEKHTKDLNNSLRKYVR